MSLTAAAVAVMISSAAPAASVPATPLPLDAPPVTGAVADEPPSTQAEPSVDGAAATQAAPAPATTAAPAGGTAAPEAASDSAGASEIIVMPRKPPPPGDPLERINEKSFAATQAVDQAVIEPVAKIYNKGLPRPVRQGLRNFFSNLTEPVVFVAFLLELKPGKAAETAGRFAINSTMGLAGLVDVAKRKPFHLPYRPNGLANVLGYYGVGPGPYFYLPIVGPTTLRDIVGDTVDRALLPAVVGSPFNKPEVVIPSSILSQLGERAAFDEEIRKIRQQDNPYAYYRELYLAQRKAEIDALHGRSSPPIDAVYGPGMRTAGGKKDGDRNTDAPVPESGSAPKADPAPALDAPPAAAPQSPTIVPEPVQP